MKSAHVVLTILGVGVLGAAIALFLLMPLPPTTDLYAARRWGVGAGYIGVVVGFPLGLFGVPIVVGLHPYPNGDDASGAGQVAALIALIVAVDWITCAALLSVVIDAVRLRRANHRASTSSPLG